MQRAAGALQHQAVDALAVFGGQRGGGKAAVVQQRQAGGVDAVFGPAGAVLGALRRAQQPGEQVQVVDVHIVERAALAGGVKRRVPDAVEEIIIPAAARAKAGHGPAHRGELGQLRLQKGVLRQVIGGDGLQQHNVLCVRQRIEFPCFGRRAGERLFQYDVVACRQRPLSGRVVQVVGGADVHGVKPACGVAGGFVGIHGRDAVLLRPGAGFGAALRAAAQRRDAKFRHFGQVLQKFIDDAAGGQHGQT